MRSEYTITAHATASFVDRIVVTSDKIQFYQKQKIIEATEDEWLQARAMEWREYWANLPREQQIIHDPEWRNRILSIQNAADGNTPFWKVARSATVGFMFAGSAVGVLGTAPITLTPIALASLFAWGATAGWPKKKDDKARQDDIKRAEASRRAYEQRKTEVDGLRNLIKDKNLITGPKVSQDA